MQLLNSENRKDAEVVRQKSQYPLCTGFKELDSLTGGFKPADLILVAGRPSMGKTSFCINVIEQMAIKKRIPTIMFSLQWQQAGFYERMLSSLSGIELRKIEALRYDSNELKKLQNIIKNRLGGIPLHIIDNHFPLTTNNIRKMFGSMIKDDGIRFIVIDYIQLLSRNMGVKKEIAALKNMAQDFNIPIMVTSQLPRTVEQRRQGRPLLSDLEEIADMKYVDTAMFLYRPYFYMKCSCFEKGYAKCRCEKERIRHTAEVILVKPKKAKISLSFDDEILRFGKGKK